MGYFDSVFEGLSNDVRGKNRRSGNHEPDEQRRKVGSVIRVLIMTEYC